MILRLRYGFLYGFLAFMLAGLLAGCDQHRLNQRFTLWRGDKIPYGTWYAYDNLHHIFPEATVLIEKRSPDRSKSFTVRNARSYIEDARYDDKKSAYIIIAPEVLPDESEIGAIFNMIGQGNHVFISALQFSRKLLDTLHLKTFLYAGFFNMRDSLTVNVQDPVEEDRTFSFTYPGQAMDNYFTGMDSTVTHILGTNATGRANFIKINYASGGALYLHLAPSALTNFFLLHKQNKAYYDEVLSQLPPHIKLIRWDEYFRYHSYGDGNDSNAFSALGWLSQQPPLYWSGLLLLLLLLTIYLFESKRRQRLIPVRPALKNASLDFVRTIGRLYYQRRDNGNLAAKMTAHFLDHVRNRYNIPTSVLDEEFENRLAHKSGYPQAAIHDIVYQARALQDMPQVNDEDLLAFNGQLENFYKHS